MKTFVLSGLLMGVSLGGGVTLAQVTSAVSPTSITESTNVAPVATAQTTVAPANTAPLNLAATNAAPTNAAPANGATAEMTPTNAAAASVATTNAAPAPAVEKPAVVSTRPAPAQVPILANGEKGLRMNFRNVPLDMVLNYLSEASGFIIVKETEVRGKVDVWSQQPLSKDEAVKLLNSILNMNGYAAVRDDRTLTIVSRDDAKKRNIPVRKGSKPEEIPKNDEMVTQIIPVRYANALQMTKDLLPLLPTFAQMTANESGNALVITDTQADIRRMAEIVQALDTAISGISAIRVFSLNYADAKEMAAVIKELFPAPSNSGNGRGGMGGGMGGGNPMAMFMGRGGGGGPGGGQGGGAGGQGGTGVSEARQAASRVTAVADERTNSLVVSAPDELMPHIEGLVNEIDKNAENITELRVFHLQNSDPVEMADVLSQLFPSSTQTDSSRSSLQFRGGGGRFGGGFAGGGMSAVSQTGTSSRAQQKGRVTAVADQRTASVIVSAASDLMPQISEMIAQLDGNPAKKQKVFVYALENADVENVQQILNDMFASQTSLNSRNRSSQQNNSALTTRRNQSNQSMGQNSSSSLGGRSTSRGGSSGGFGGN